MPRRRQKSARIYWEIRMEKGTSKPDRSLASNFLPMLPPKELLKNLIKEARVTALIKTASNPKKINTGERTPPIIVA